MSRHRVYPDQATGYNSYPIYSVRRTDADIIATTVAEIPGVISHVDVSNTGSVTLSGPDIDVVADLIGSNDIDSTFGGTPPVWGDDVLNGLDAAIFTTAGKEIIRHFNISNSLDNIWDGGGFIAYALEMKSTTGAFGLWAEHDSHSFSVRGTDTTGRPFEFQFQWTGDDGTWKTAADSLPNDVPSILLLEYNTSSASNQPVVTINATEYTVGSGLTELETPTGTRLESLVHFWGHDTVNAADVNIGEEIIGGAPLSAANKAFLLTYLRDKWLP